MTQQVIDQAEAILMARRGCTREQASWLLSTGAKEHEMNMSEFAACLVAALELGRPPRPLPG